MEDVQFTVGGCPVPIHTFHPGEYEQFGVPVRQLQDGCGVVL